MKPLLAGAALALIPSVSAFAQQNNTQLEPVVVEGEAGDSATGPVDGVVAKETKTGSKTATKLTEIPQFVSVIGRQEIDDQGAQKIDESLRYTAGVFTQPFGPDSDTNWIFIRGFQATDTGVYMDGLQLFSYGFGGFYVDSFGIERIEVLKGPASVLYGGSNPGGIVNYVSKRPDGRQRYVETGVNDAGRAYLGFDVGDVASDGVVSYRVNGRVAGGDTYSDLQDGWRGFISPSITWQPDDQTRLTVLANFSHIDENHNGGNFLPYIGTVVDRVVDGVNYGRIDPDANFTEPSIDLYKREQGSIGYEFEHTFDNDWTVRSNTRFGAASIDEASVYPNGWASATELDRINFGHDTDVMTFLSDLQIEGKFETGAIEHTLLAGIDYKYYNIDQVQSSALFGTTPPIDAFDPVYGSPLTPRVSYLNQDLTQKQLGFYAQDQLRFGDGWLVTLNGRYDWGWLSADNGPTYYSATSSSQSSNVGDFSGRAGLAYEFDNGITPYASIATFFNPIIGTDANGDLFKPEEGVQYEVGVKYEPTFVDGLFTLSVFDLTRQNVAVASPDNPFAQVQRGEVRSRGVELEGKVNITEDLRVTGAFTAYDLEITKDTNPALIGKTPFIVPELMVSASVDYTFRGDWYDGVSIGAGVRHLGSSWADNENTAKVPAVTLADLKLGYEKENWGVDLNITNLFDKTYVASCQTTLTCSYGEGRSFKLKAHTTW
ncbi:TonB-dependent siderophore receptor [Mesorhizobium sp. M0938]|uniref:TonB-dependent siderophore receptor n=1 Tax=unclassified Mesorhizobium TaxID=325217 RepID=UPI00333CB0B4